MHRYLIFIVVTCLLFACAGDPVKQGTQKVDDSYSFPHGTIKRVIKNAAKDGETHDLISDIDSANNALNSGDVEGADQFLNSSQRNVTLLPESKQIEWWRVQSDLAYEKRDIEASLNYERQLHLLLTEGARRNRGQIIFERLLHLDPFNIQRLLERMSANVFAHGWISLVDTVTSFPATIQQQKIAFERWRKRNKNHPASDYTFASVQRFLAFNSKPTSVALLLPLEGSFMPLGKLIEQGFTSVSTGLDIQVVRYNVFDNASLQNAFESMKTRHIDAVVGPIDPALVKQVWQEGKYPILLTLNYIDNPERIPNYAQFGLGIEDEAKILAQAVMYSGKKNILVLAENTSQGLRGLRRFEEIVPKRFYTRLIFDNASSLASGISNAVGVNAEDLEQLRNDLKEYEENPDAFYQSPITTLRSRNTIEAVVVFASKLPTTQIKPLLDFYYAFNTPVFATSLSYSLDEADSLGKEYEGIFITDMPTLHHPPGAFHALVRGQYFDIDASLRRFFALGIDAALAVSNLRRLRVSPGIQIIGSTGTLSYDEQKQVISRSPHLFIVKDGRLVSTKGYAADCTDNTRLCF